MDGTPSHPKTIESIHLIEFLDKHNIKFCYYDIHSDLEIRKSAIEFSKWTTFPQIYYDHQFLGDLYIAQILLLKLPFETT